MDKASDSRPPCFLYHRPSGKWQAFKSLSISIKGQSVRFLGYTNSYADSQMTIKREITYDFNVQYSRVIPSDCKRAQSLSNSTGFFPSVSESSEMGEALRDLKIESIIILRDPECEYEPILLGFLLQKTKFEENNKELKYIRFMVSKIHCDLKYGKEALIYQVTERMKVILQKILKHTLVYIAGLFNIPAGLPVEDKLKHLASIQLMGDQKQQIVAQEHLETIRKDPLFISEVTSIAYKVIATVGIFPTYVELNTMDEMNLLLKVKSLFTSLTNAPYGSQHHASFSIGNLRYSFINVAGDKEKQRVYIYPDLQRRFRINNHEYFRVKFFDFFPMDRWVERLARQTLDLLPLYFLTVKVLRQPDLRDFWSKSVTREDVEVCEGIAKDFFEKYKSELDENLNGGMFRKITDSIADADVRGYHSLHSNCQTIVSDVIVIMVKQLQRHIGITPLCDMSKLSTVQRSWNDQLLREFLKFGSEFNHNYDYIAPFPLACKMSYFDIYSDKDSCELMNPKNFKNLQEAIKEFKLRPNIKAFMEKIEDCLQMASKIHIKTRSDPESPLKMRKLPNIRLENAESFSVVACLLMLTYNDLFSVRREIKLAKECEEKLAQNDTKDVGTFLCVIRTSKLEMLYEQKYKLAELYKELTYYYYNSVRLDLKIKAVNKVSCIGFLLSRKPFDEAELDESEIVYEGEKVEENM